MPDTQLWSSAKSCYSLRISSPSLVCLLGVPSASLFSVSEKRKCLLGCMIIPARSYPSSSHTRHTLHLDFVSLLSYSTASRSFSLKTGMLATSLWLISEARKFPKLDVVKVYQNNRCGSSDIDGMIIVLLGRMMILYSSEWMIYTITALSAYKRYA
jgi:hypothetical protein